MKVTSRRSLLKAAGVGGVAAGLGVIANTEASSVQRGPAPGHAHRPVSGPMAQATVTFGAWQGDQGWDRFDGDPFDPIGANHHTLAPHEVTIRAGGSVSYIISGFHQVVVYDNGTEPEDIDTSNLVGPPEPIFIDDPNRRIYRGLNPLGLPQDRVESVMFSRPGRYLVICGLIFHFNDEMWGFVRVLP